MKLILCPVCQDVFKLDQTARICKCGASSGKYNGTLKAEIAGKAIPIGFDNYSLGLAIHNRPKEGLGEVFTAFIIPEDCKNIKKV